MLSVNETTTHDGRVNTPDVLRRVDMRVIVQGSGLISTRF
jgi:hypothetical protein